MGRERSTTDQEVVYRTLDGDEASLPRSALEPLRSAVRGGVLTDDDAGYDDARRVWNAMVDRHPAVITRCGSSSDVRAAIRFAREHDMLVGVRGGGHHIAGNAVPEGGLVLDLSGMRNVHVDPDRRIARAGGGALLGDVDQETTSFGLAVPLGINSTTGLGGLCLGGGFGWLTRKHGLTIDNLISADVVTASGEIHTVSASRDPDLFWAIRGGGGNFGVATSFELGLHAVGPMVQTAIVVYPGAIASDVLRGWRDLTDAAPDELSAWIVLRKAPPLPFLPASAHGTDVVIMVVVYAGDRRPRARAVHDRRVLVLVERRQRRRLDEPDGARLRRGRGLVDGRGLPRAHRLRAGVEPRLSAGGGREARDVDEPRPPARHLALRRGALRDRGRRHRHRRHDRRERSHARLRDPTRDPARAGGPRPVRLRRDRNAGLSDLSVGRSAGPCYGLGRCSRAPSSPPSPSPPAPRRP